MIMKKFTPRSDGSWIMSYQTDLCSLCQSNGFSLKEYPLEGRLLIVLLNPKIIIRRDLAEDKKEFFVSAAISHLTNCSECRLAIFWHGQKDFFHL